MAVQSSPLLTAGVKEATPALSGSISVKGKLWLAMVNNIKARLDGVNPPLELSTRLYR